MYDIVFDQNKLIILLISQIFLNLFAVSWKIKLYTFWMEKTNYNLKERLGGEKLLRRGVVKWEKIKVT